MNRIKLLKAIQDGAHAPYPSFFHYTRRDNIKYLYVILPNNKTRLIPEDDYKKAEEDLNEPNLSIEEFEERFNNRITPTKKQTTKYLKKLEDNKNENELLVLQFNTTEKHTEASSSEEFEKFITVSKTYRPYIVNLLTKRDTTEADYSHSGGSDVMADISLSYVSKIEHSYRPIDEKVIRNAENKNGGFFEGANMTNIDLSRYQIYTSEEHKQKRVIKHHCILYTLKQSGIDDEKLKKISTTFENSMYFPISKMQELVDLIENTIHIHRLERKSKEERTLKYPFKDTNPIQIALYKNHYFTFEDTIYSSFSVINYDVLKDVENFNDVFKIRKEKNKKETYRRDKKNYKIDSLKLIKLMDEQEMFNFNDENMLITTDGGLERDAIDIPLTNIDSEQILFGLDEKTGKPKKKKRERRQFIFYADLEAIVYTGDHKPFMSGIIEKGGDKPKISVSTTEKSMNWFYGMFEYVKEKVAKKKKKEATKDGVEEDIIIYFHNMKYDMKLLTKHMNIRDSCEKDGFCYQYEVSCKIGKERMVFLIRDSYKMINVGLEKFSKMFGLKNKKQEAIAYTYFNYVNINKKKNSVKKYMKHLKEADKSVFEKIMKEDGKLFNYNGKTFDAMAYYKFYLKQDVMTLYEGLEKFQALMNKITNQSIYECLTISRFAFEFFAEKWAFEGVYKTKGNLRQYMAQAVYGGRVHVNTEIKKKVIKEVINDYDANSLYPSAFYRMCIEKQGLAKGKAKVLQEEEKTYSELEKKDYYIVTVRINKINKKLDNPFIQVKNDDDISDYVNELPNNKPIITTIDKITLEDYIKFHNIEFDIIKGVYFDEGFNNRMGRICNNLYQERLIYKAEENDAMAAILKLILNSTYGKTIPKKSFIKINYVNQNDFNNFMFNHYHNIIGPAVKINGWQYKIKTATTDDSYNLASVGIKCLSMSKRIMNEVMALASKHGIKIFYQDTDSMHMRDADIKRLEELYTKKYPKRILHGENLCQFKSDFELKGCTNIKAKASCFLAKKSYIDILFGEDEKTGEIKEGQHIRLKAITEAGIKSKIAEYNGDALSLFEDLASGKEIEFVLNPKDKVAFVFDHNSVTTRETGSFKRTLKF